MFLFNSDNESFLCFLDLSSNIKECNSLSTFINLLTSNVSSMDITYDTSDSDVYKTFGSDGDMYRIKTEKGDLLVSEKHRIYVKRVENRRLYSALPLLLFVLLGVIGVKKKGGKT